MPKPGAGREIRAVSAELEARVETLESLMADVLRVSRETDLRINRLSEEEMSAFKDEMRMFKEEMQTFREETRNDRREMNKRWGELAASLGTLVKDVVAPSVPRVLREVFD